eukprot:2714253-Pleurochrysis_carterae.AAC.1
MRKGTRGRDGSHEAKIHTPSKGVSSKAGAAATKTHTPLKGRGEHSKYVQSLSDARALTRGRSALGAAGSSLSNSSLSHTPSLSFPPPTLSAL